MRAERFQARSSLKKIPIPAQGALLEMRLFLALRRIGDEVRQAAVDVAVFVPDFRTEALRQTRFKCGIVQSRNAWIVGDVSGALTRIGNSARRHVPIGAFDRARELISTEQTSGGTALTRHRTSGIGIGNCMVSPIIDVLTHQSAGFFRGYGASRVGI